MSVYHTCASCLQKPEDGIRSSVTQVTDVNHMWVLQIESGSSGRAELLFVLFLLFLIDLYIFSEEQSS